jgi:hypothetical protein
VLDVSAPGRFVPLPRSTVTSSASVGVSGPFDVLFRRVSSARHFRPVCRLWSGSRAPVRGASNPPRHRRVPVRTGGVGERPAPPGQRPASIAGSARCRASGPAASAGRGMTRRCSRRRGSALSWSSSRGLCRTRLRDGSSRIAAPWWRWRWLAPLAPGGTLTASSGNAASAVAAYSAAAGLDCLVLVGRSAPNAPAQQVSRMQRSPAGPGPVPHSGWPAQRRGGQPAARSATRFSGR